jgi:hypothetical protein
VDVITHVPLDKTLDEDAVNLMVNESRVAVPTLTMMKRYSEAGLRAFIGRLLRDPVLLWRSVKALWQNPHGGLPKYVHARESVAAMYSAGVPILAGTDANAMPRSPLQVKHGEAMHDELDLLVEAGLSTLDALRAATSLPARHFRLEDRGVVKEGKRADLVLISGDPIQDIRATRSIQRVWCAGIEVNRSLGQDA